MSKRQERQRFIRHYKDVTGEREIDMHKVAEFAKQMGWIMPTPPSDVELLAKLFADDAQAERKYDLGTGKPYRVYHALPASGAAPRPSRSEGRTGLSSVAARVRPAWPHDGCPRDREAHGSTARPDSAVPGSG